MANRCILYKFLYSWWLELVSNTGFILANLFIPKNNVSFFVLTNDNKLIQTDQSQALKEQNRQNSS